MEQPKKSFKLVSDKKTRVILPNILTLIGVCIGLSSIKFALDSKYEIAIIAIIILHCIIFFNIQILFNSINLVF